MAQTATPAPAPAEERAAPSTPAKPAPRLNLRLDDAASYAREAPREEGATPTGSLPTLGGNAAPLEQAPLPRRDTPSSSYPVGK